MTHRLRLRRTGTFVTAAALGAVGLVAGTVLAQDKTPAAQQQDSTQLRGNERRTGAVEETVAPPLTLLWKFTGGAQNGNPSSPVVVGDTVFYSTGSERSQGGVLYAVDIRTGSEKWHFEIPGRSENFNTAPSYSEGNIFIGSSNRRMYVLKAATGEQVTALATGVANNSSPAILNGILYYGANDGRLNVLDPISTKSPWDSSKRSNQYKAGDAINSAPIVADSFVYFTSADQFVHALKSATGVFRWRVRLPFRFVTNPAGLLGQYAFRRDRPSHHCDPAHIGQYQMDGATSPTIWHPHPLWPGASSMPWIATKRCMPCARTTARITGSVTASPSR